MERSCGACPTVERMSPRWLRALSKDTGRRTKGSSSPHFASPIKAMGVNSARPWSKPVACLPSPFASRLSSSASSPP